MRICIEAADLAPPCGTVVSETVRDPIPFSGWLGLMRVLSDMLASTTDDAASEDNT
jgi:hypothetical protein